MVRTVPARPTVRQATRRPRIAVLLVATLVAVLLVPLVPSVADAAPSVDTIRLDPGGPSKTYVAVMPTFTAGDPNGSQLHWTNRSGRTVHVTDDLGVLDSGPVPDGGSFHANLLVPGVYQWDSEVGGGTIVVRATFVGAPTDRALDRLPDLPFPPRADGDIGIHPDLLVAASRTRLVVRFTDDATVADAQQALSRANVELIGALPNLDLAMVAISTPTASSFNALDNARNRLGGEPKVEAVTLDLDLRTDVLPPPSDVADDWAWYWDPLATTQTGAGGNWGHELSRVPAAWNVREVVERRGQTAASTVVIDDGFEVHENLSRMTIHEVCRPRFTVAGVTFGEVCTPVAPSDHGNHVAGIVGADHQLRRGTDRSIGTVGVDPYSRLAAVSRVGKGVDLWVALSFLLEEMTAGRMTDVRVVNMSHSIGMGSADAWVNRWGSRTCGPGAGDDATGTGPCLPHVEDGRIAMMDADGLVTRRVLEKFVTELPRTPLFVFSAGNDGDKLCVPLRSTCTERVPIPAVAMSDGAVASRDWDDAVGPNPILVVESIGTYRPGDTPGTQTPDPGPARSLFSNVGGHLSAPGLLVSTETSGPGSEATGCRAMRDSHCFMNGTSMAAPFVAGVAGLLMAWDPELTAAQVRSHLLTWAVADTTGGAAPRTDAYLALSALPGVVRAVVDVNDPSPDGNRRVIRSADGSTALDEELSAAPEGFTEPDDVVDLRDFRRFRDAWLASCLVAPEAGCPSDISIDGPADHPKRDLNQDGCISSAAPGLRQLCPAEQTWSRFDFNGDGLVSATSRALVGVTTDGRPAAAPAEATLMTDLDVLASQWDADSPGAQGYTAADLEDLLLSGDLEVGLTGLDRLGGTTAEVVAVSGGTEIGRRTVPLGPDAADSVLLTVAAGTPVEITARVGTPAGPVEQRAVDLVLAPGEDRRVDLCGGLDVDVTPRTLRPDGSTAQVVATVRTCGEPADGIEVSFDLEGPMAGATLSAPSAVTGADGRAVVTVNGGTGATTYEVVATADVPTPAGSTTSREARTTLRVTEPYHVETVATTDGDSGYTALYQVSSPGRDLPGPSVNAAGQVAFAAELETGGATVLVAEPGADPRRPATATTVFPVGDLPAGAWTVGSPQLNDRGEVVALIGHPGTDPGHVHRQVVLGSVAEPEASRVVAASIDDTLGAPASTLFRRLAAPTLSNEGDVVFRARDRATGTDHLVREHGAGYAVGDPSPDAVPRVADDGTTVAFAGRPGVLAGTIRVGDALHERWGALAVAGSTGWVGQPAISDDGKAVAFVADQGDGAALWVALRTGPDVLSWRLPEAVAGGGRTGELGTGTDGSPRQLDLRVPDHPSLVDPLRVGSRPGVVHLERGPAGLDGDRVLVSFLGTPNGAGDGFTGQWALWTQVIDVVADGAGGFDLVPQRPVAVIERGSLLDGQEVRWMSIADSLSTPVDALDPLAHHLAFAVETADREHHVLRATWTGSPSAVGADSGSAGAAVAGHGSARELAFPGTPAASGPAPLVRAFLRDAGVEATGSQAWPSPPADLDASLPGPTVPASFGALAETDDLEVLDSPHITAFVVSDDSPVVRDVVTITNRTRTIDGRAAAAAVHVSQLQLAKAVPADGSISVTVPDSMWTSGSFGVTVGAPLDASGTVVTATISVARGPNRPPVVSLDGPVTVARGADVTLRYTTNDPDGGTITGAWDLDGDGVFERPGAQVRTLRLTAEQIETLVCGGTCVAGTPYPIGVQVTDNGGLQASATSTLTVSDLAGFSVQVHPSVMTTNPGHQRTTEVVLDGEHGYHGPVSMTLEDVPVGWSTYVTPSVEVPGSGVLRVSPPVGTPDGSFDLTLVVTDGQRTVRTTLTVVTAFALVPQCDVTVSGTITDRVTGLPVERATVRLELQGRSVPVMTDDRGAYTGAVPLPSSLASATVGLRVQHGSYYEGTGRSEVVTCERPGTGDLELEPHRFVDVTARAVVGVASPGNIFVAGTDEPLPDATARVGATNVPTTTHVSREDGRIRATVRHRDPDASTRISVTFSKPGHFDETRSVDAPQGASVVDVGDVPLLEICQGVLGGGWVVDQYGDPVPGATVTYGLTTVVADVDGRFDFGVPFDLAKPNRKTQVQLRWASPTGPDWPTRAQGSGASPPAGCGQTTPDATLTLVRPEVERDWFGTVRGVVRDAETGEPVPGARVAVRSRSTGMDVESKITTTGFDGSYEVTDVLLRRSVADPGPVAVVATATLAGHYPDTAETMISAGETATLDLALLLTRYGAVEGYVYDAETGEPVPGVEVEDVFGVATTDVDGYYRMGGVRLGDRNADVVRGYTARRFDPAYPQNYWQRTGQVTVRADETSRLDFHLLAECPGASVSGVVVNAVGLTPLDGVRVAVEGTSSTTDADGRFLLPDLRVADHNTPRTVSVVASKPGFDTAWREITLFCGAEIVVDFGQPEHGFGVVTGTVTDSAGEPLKDVFIGSAYGESTTTDVTGGYRLERAPLAEGGQEREWRVTARSGNRQVSAPVVVRADMEAVRDFVLGTANEPPVADDVTVTTPAGTPVDVMLPAVDPDGDALTFEVVSPPANGTLSGTAPELVYTPDPGFDGTDSFRWAVTDGTERVEATVTVTVTPAVVPDRPPVLTVPTVVEVTAGRTRSVDVRATDPDGDRLTLTARGLPAFGTFADDGGGHGTLTFAPPADADDQDLVVTITASDGTHQVEGEITLRVAAVLGTQDPDPEPDPEPGKGQDPATGAEPTPGPDLGLDPGPGREPDTGREQAPRPAPSGTDPGPGVLASTGVDVGVGVLVSTWTILLGSALLVVARTRRSGERRS